MLKRLLGIKKASALLVVSMLVISLVQPASAIVNPNGKNQINPISLKAAAGASKLLAAGTSPLISNAYVTNQNYTIGSSNYPKFNFELNASAYGQVDIYKAGSGVVQTLISQFSPNPALTAGAHEVQWVVPSITEVGSYYFRVRVQNTLNSNDTATYSSDLITVSSSSLTDATLSNVYVENQTYNPTDSTNSIPLIHFTVNVPSGQSNPYVNIKVYNINDLNNAVKTFDNNQYPAGNYMTGWNGKNDNNNNVPVGTYVAKVNLYRVCCSTTVDSEQTASIYIQYSNQSNSAPNVTSVSVSPSSFNPYNGEQTTVSYSVDKSFDYATIRFYNGNTLVKTVTTNPNQSSITWNGYWDNGTRSTGTYSVMVTASNYAYGTGNSSSATVYVNNTSNSNTTITNLYASPNPFNANAQNTNIYYTLDNAGYVTVQVGYSSSNNFKTLLSNSYQTSGSHNVIWDGTYNNGSSLVGNGTYTVTVQVRNSSNGVITDTRTTTVQVSSTGSTNNTGTIIQNLTINPDVFNPNSQNAVAYYRLSKQANVTVDILDNNGNVIRNLVSSVTRYPNNSNNIYIPYYGSGDYSYADTWNGRDRYGNKVVDGLYRFKIYAYSTDGQSDTETAYVEVNTNNSIIGFPTNQTCAGYRDVSIYNPYCRAIEEMKNLGVFNGYDNGTFGSYQVITRAETVKVVLLALGIPNNYSNAFVNFLDVSNNSNEWYMSFLRTAVAYGIVQGYTDNTFRPNQTINRVEMLKVFMKSSGVNVPYCSNAPYNDTPNNADTRWFIDYVCFARTYGLMHDDGKGNFNPASPITRGDVADLFYQFQKNGFRSYTSSNGYNTNYPYTYSASAPVPSYYSYNNYGY